MGQGSVLPERPGQDGTKMGLDRCRADVWWKGLERVAGPAPFSKTLLPRGQPEPDDVHARQQD